MPTTYWTGNGQNTAQVDTLTVTAVANGGTLTATINNKNVTYTCTSTDTTTTAAAAWAALLDANTAPPEFGEVSFVASAGVITCTATVSGTPFTMSNSQAGGATCTLTHITANVSQSDVNNAANWLRNGAQSLPQNGDDVVLANSSVPLLWNLDQLAAVQFQSFTRWQSFTGSVGLPENNPKGYFEYRPTYFQFSSCIVGGNLQIILGAGAGNGPTRERYDVGSAGSTLTLVASGSAADTYNVRFLGTSVNNIVNVESGSVGVAMLPGEIANLTSGTIGSGGTLDLGSGVTISSSGGGGTFTFSGGTGSLYTTPGAVVARNGGSITLAASGGVYSSVTANDSASVSLTQPMTITNLTLARSSTLDNSSNTGAVTVTNSTIDATCQIIDPNSTMTWTNATTVNGQVQSGPFQFAGQRTVKVT